MSMDTLQLHDGTAIATHELRNALTALKGYAELMQRRERYDPQAVTMILTQSRQMLRLLDDLRDSSADMTLPPPLRRSVVDLVALARASIARARVQTARHTLRLESHAEMIIGWYDADRLGEVFDNLLGNAIKYAPDGGEIVIRITVHEDAIHLAVTDRGIGIPAAALPHLFQRSYRADQPGARGVAGQGLGLFISKALVEAHGGTIAVESAVREGSTFVIALPYAVNAARWHPNPAARDDSRSPEGS